MVFALIMHGVAAWITAKRLELGGGGTRGEDL
jgi:hypothetical protein